jgi:type VI secretion system protein ImpM
VIGGFGKIPAKPDFVRVGHSDATTRTLENWLDEASSRVRESGLALPDTSIRFVMRPANSPGVGVIRPSQDAVGRRFPLTVFHMLMWSAAQPRWSGLPVLVDPFIEEADGILRESARFDVEMLRARVTTLWTPGSADLEATDEICRRVLADTPWRAMAERMFQEPIFDRAAYAFRTALIASQRDEPQSIDCPIVNDVDLFFWLELFRRCARTEAIAFVWIEEPSPRLIVSLGPLPVTTLLSIADPRRESAQLWPLTTTRAAALEAAVAALGPVLEPIRDGSAPLHGLLDVLSRARNT